MRKISKKIILLLAVFTVIAHSSFPHIHLHEIMARVNHHHHGDSPAGRHQHHDTAESKEENHNLFSFARLDEDFIPGKDQFEKFELPILYLSPVAITYLFNNFPKSPIQEFGWYKEYPPPDDHRYNLPSRAPPAFSLS